MKKTLILRCWNDNENNCDSIDGALVEATPEWAQAELHYRAVFELANKGCQGDLSELNVWDYMPQGFSLYEGWPEDDENTDLQAKLEALLEEEMTELQPDVVIPEAQYQCKDHSRKVVRSDGISWAFRQKYSDNVITTAEISWADLEAIATGGESHAA